MRKVRERLPLFITGLATLALGAASLISGCSSGGGSAAVVPSMTKAQLGRGLFHLPSLSEPGRQSCASCHVPNSAFTDPRQDSPTSEGAVAGLFGKRQTSSLMYLAFSPAFHFDAAEQDFLGGQFWDGRAVDLKDQVHFPLLNAVEMNNATLAQIVDKVSHTDFATPLKQLYGENIFSNPALAFDAIADAIATFEMSAEFSPFSSKYDAFLKGKTTLTAAETRGLALFKGKALCANCHPADPTAGQPPLFTDFTYDNIGLPKNLANRFLTMPANINPDGAAFADIGLMQTTNRPEDRGRMKVPTLRNIAITAPYYHNGIFKTLDEAVQFYNKRDLGTFGTPEFPVTMNTTELGNLGLTDAEIADIVAFLKTLTDGFVP